MRAARLVAKQELLDLFRSRQVWVSLLLQPIVFVGMVGFFGWLGQQQNQAFRAKTVTIAMSGDQADAQPFAAIFRSSNFRVRNTTDVFGELTKGTGQADVGMTIPQGANRSLANKRTVDIRLIYRKGDNKSEVALGRATAVLDAFSAFEIGKRLQPLGLTKELTPVVAIKTTDATSTSKGVRLTLGSLLPVLVLLQSTSLLTTASAMLAGRKDKRTLEPLLLLPASRQDILSGAGAAAFLMGLIPVAAFIVPVLAAMLLPFGFVHGIASIGAVALGLGIVGPLLAALMVGFGLLIGTLSRGSESGSALGSFGFVPFFAVGMLFVLVSNPPNSLPMYAIPAYGAGLLMRTMVGHGFALGPLLVVVVSTLVCVAVLLRLASSYLETERAVLRPSG